MDAVWAVRPVNVIYRRELVATLDYQNEKGSVAIVRLALTHPNDQLIADGFLRQIGATNISWNSSEATFEIAIAADGRRREVLYGIHKRFQDYLADVIISKLSAAS